MSSLQTLAEILKRLEQKVDNINGSIARTTERLATLEKEHERAKAQVGILKWVVTAIVVPLLLIGASRILTILTA